MKRAAPSLRDGQGQKQSNQFIHGPCISSFLPPGKVE